MSVNSSKDKPGISCPYNNPVKADTAAFPRCGKAPKDQILQIHHHTTRFQTLAREIFCLQHALCRILLNPIMYSFTATSKLLVIIFRENLNLADKKQYHHLITRLNFFREMLSSEKYLFPN